MKKTVAKWSSSVHNDFRFTFKLFREITHAKNLDFNNAHVQNFMETISNVGTKKGCLLVQFPPSLTIENIYQLDNLLHHIGMSDPGNLFHVAVEFRNKGWYNDDVYHLLDFYKASLVIHDIPASATPLKTMSSEIVYVRFHGPTGNYKGSYTGAFLNEYAEYIREWLDTRKTVYVYFNNTNGDAFNNLVTLKNILQ